MPSRRRHRSAKPSAAEELDPVSRFGLLLKESAEREKQKQASAAERRKAKQDAARAKRARAEELVDAKRELQRAIDAVRRAKRDHRGIAEADRVWRAAKAKVIELETGAAPDWADAAATEAAEPPMVDGDPTAPAGSDESDIADGEDAAASSDEADDADGVPRDTDTDTDTDTDGVDRDTDADA